MVAKAVQGAQVVGRAVLLLRLVVQASETGATFPELVRVSGLTRPTVHRLLNSLAAEGLLDHAVSTGRWYLGPEIYVLGSVAAQRFPIEDLARPSLRRLADETGESSFFSMRRGNETVCLMREEGSFPVRSFVLHEGVRFPIGVASAGMAIMAYLSTEEVAELVADETLMAKYGPGNSPEAIQMNLEKTRSTGYSVNPGLIVEGSWGMGAAIFDSAGRPAWAISLTGIEPRFRPDRQEFMGKLLLEEAHKNTAQLQQRRW